MTTICETVAMSRRSGIIVLESWIRTGGPGLVLCRYAVPYQEMLHAGGKTAWTMSGPVIPATGLPMISGGQGLGFEEAEVLSKVDKKDLSRRREGV